MFVFMRYLLWLLLLTGCSSSYAQKNFVYVDAMGLFGKQLATYPSVSKATYTVGFERIVRPRTGLNVALALGQMPITIESTTLLSLNVETFTGARLNLSMKFYTAREKSKRYGNGYGFFVGPYLGFMAVKHHLYSTITPQKANSFAETYTNTGIMGGAGVHLGYKFLIKQKYSIELLGGGGWGRGSKFNTPVSILRDNTIYNGNLVLIQTNLGYRF